MRTPGPLVPLVLGAGGMLGSAVARLLEEEYPGTVSATRAEADVTDRFRLEAEVERLRPTVLVNCAAYSDFDGCEADQERAWKTNAEGAGNVASAAAAAGCRVVHVSSAAVFDGTIGRPYAETDPPRPVSALGRSQLEGERRVAAAAPDHLIVRTSWLFGYGRGCFVGALRRRISEGSAVKASADEFGSPTGVADLAEAVTRLLSLEYRGIVHFCNAGCASRYEVAEAIADAIGAGPARLEPVPAGAAGDETPRLGYAALDTALYARLCGTAPRPWREALRAHLVRQAS